MWPLRNAASTGFVLKPATNTLALSLPPFMVRYCLGKILASSCRLPPNAQPMESNQNNFDAWIASGERCSYFSAHAHSAMMCDSRRFDSVGCCDIMIFVLLAYDLDRAAQI